MWCAATSVGVESPMTSSDSLVTTTSSRSSSASRKWRNFDSATTYMYIHECRSEFLRDAPADDDCLLQ